MFTIVGAGFGLYGYLPALVDGLGETVALPRSYQSRVMARPELSSALQGIHWVEKYDDAIAIADSVIIAIPPKQQFEVALRCIATPTVNRLILEKPLADTPDKAQSLLSMTTSARKRCRVGFTLTHTAWIETLEWPKKNTFGNNVLLEWSFMAHHFSKEFDTWKRRHADGGGAIRFFGIHVIALLAKIGYGEIDVSSVDDAQESAEPKRWKAVFSGENLPECHVIIDSRSSERSFRIIHRSINTERVLIDITDPFDAESHRLGADRRVATLERLLRSFDHDDRRYHDYYEKVNLLWKNVENKNSQVNISSK